jgi:hypothetical protein
LKEKDDSCSDITDLEKEEILTKYYGNKITNNHLRRMERQKV